MNWRSVRAIFGHEDGAFFRTIWQSLASPVLSHGAVFVVSAPPSAAASSRSRGVPTAPSSCPA